MLVTQRGVAVNPKKQELLMRLKDAGLPVTEIEALKHAAEKITGIPKKVAAAGRPVANVIWRDGTQIDTIRCI